MTNYAALVLVFVIWFVNGNDKAANVLTGKNSENSTKCSRPEPPCTIQIMYKPETVQSCFTVPNTEMLIASNCSGIVWQRKANSRLQSEFPLNKSLWNIVVRWQRSSLFDNAIFHSKISYDGICGAAVDANDATNNWPIVPDIATGHPYMLNTDFWSVRGQKFCSRKAELLVASFPQSLCRAPECESEDGNHDSTKSNDVVMIGAFPKKAEKAHDPFKEGGTGLLIGMIIGGLILAYQYAKGEF